MIVQLGDWACGGGLEKVKDTDGRYWFLETMTGWFDSDAVRSSTVDFEDRDGVADSDPTYGAKVITLSGTVEAPSRASLRAARDLCMGLLAGDGRWGTLTVLEDDRGLARIAEVRLNGPTLTSTIGPFSATFSMSLFAPDRRRYSQQYWTLLAQRYQPGAGVPLPFNFPMNFGELGVGGILRLTNRGDKSTPLDLYMNGYLVNPMVRRIESNQTIDMGMTVDQGQTLIIRTGNTPSIELGDYSRRQVARKAEFFMAPPGESTLYFSADDGDGTLMVGWRDAW